MRVIIFIVSFLVSTTISGQIKLTGKYCSPRDFVGHCITFYQNGIFLLEPWADASDSKNAMGKFKIEKDSVVLIFSLDSIKNTISIQELPCDMTDSIVLNFSVSHGPNNPLSKALIFLNDGVDSRELAVADSTGLCTVKIKKSSQERAIAIIQGGYKSRIIHIKADRCRSFFINMASVFSGYENFDTLKYQIKRDNKKGWYLQYRNAILHKN